MRTRLFAATLSAARSASLKVSSRPYSDSPYPFTRPSPNVTVNKSAEDAASSSPYPFTKPDQIAKAAEDAPRRDPVAGPGMFLQDSTKVAENRIESVGETIGHKPDYGVAADYRTSTFSPIPLRVMDGSEEGDTVPAAILSGAPTDLQARTVRIFKPSKTATQSGDWHGHVWRMDWDILQKGHRWENPLMGWQSSGDIMQGTNLNFKSKEDAIRFANKQGYEYFVQEPNERRRVPKAYATQFVHQPGKLKEIRTK